MLDKVIKSLESDSTTAYVRYILDLSRAVSYD